MRPCWSSIGAGLLRRYRTDTELADELAKRFPEDTVVQFNYLPTVRSQVALDRRDSSKALKALQAAASYELGTEGEGGFALSLCYLRGQAYLASRKGSEAAAEFQKILDHRGIVVNEPIGALAHLGIARAYVLRGDTTKARVAYQDFLTLWKDADPDIPILIAASLATSAERSSLSAHIGFMALELGNKTVQRDLKPCSMKTTSKTGHTQTAMKFLIEKTVAELWQET
jgi:hypothetical protein